MKGEDSSAGGLRAIWYRLDGYRWDSGTAMDGWTRIGTVPWRTSLCYSTVAAKHASTQIAAFI